MMIPVKASMIMVALSLMICFATVNGQTAVSWSPWSEWSRCSSSCGEGQSQRTRICLAPNGQPANLEGCQNAAGLGPVEIRTCMLCGCKDLDWCVDFPRQTCQENDFIRTSCPISCGVCQTVSRGFTVSWSPWSEWSRCSSSCGEGQSQRTRICLAPNGQPANPEGCQDATGLGPVEIRSCMSARCAVVTPWTACSRTCGGGQRSRQNCVVGNCTTAIQDCNTQSCLGSGRIQVEYVARTFFRTITAASSSLSSRQSCPGDFVSSDRSVRMYGSPCSDKQQAPPDLFQTSPSKSKRDVLFVIDESSSVGVNNFKIFLRLARTIVDKSFCGAIGVGEDKTRVGAVTFDSRQHLQMDLQTSYVKADVLSRIQNINFNFTTSGFTCIGDTLRYALRNVLTVTRGGRANNPDTEQVIILLSDGCSYCTTPDTSQSDVRLVAEELKRNGVVVINFLVGSHSDECIEEMKSLIDGSRCYQLFQFRDWGEVDIAINTMAASQCPNAWTSSQC